MWKFLKREVPIKDIQEYFLLWAIDYPPWNSEENFRQDHKAQYLKAEAANCFGPGAKSNLPFFVFSQPVS